MRMGQGMKTKKILSHNLLGQDENTTCGATRLDAYRARLIAYHHTQLFVYGGVTPSYLLSHVLRHVVVCVSACPQESIPVHGTYCDLTRLQLSVMSCIESTCSPSSVYPIIHKEQWCVNMFFGKN